MPKDLHARARAKDTARRVMTQWHSEHEVSFDQVARSAPAEGSSVTNPNSRKAAKKKSVVLYKPAATTRKGNKRRSAAVLCPACGASFSKQDQLDSHLLQKHRDFGWQEVEPADRSKQRMSRRRRRQQAEAEHSQPAIPRHGEVTSLEMELARLKAYEAEQVAALLAVRKQILELEKQCRDQKK